MSSPTPDPAPAQATPSDAAPSEPAVDEPQVDEPAVDEPQDVTLLVDPARVRRAPKYGAFFTVGAIVGIVGGLWLGLWLAGSVDPTRGDVPLQKPGVYVTVIVAVCTTITVIVAGLLALLADRRSLRKR